MINKIYKSVLITGASSGIGLETLKRFFKENIKIYALDKDISKLERLKRKHNFNIIQMNLFNTNEIYNILSKLKSSCARNGKKKKRSCSFNGIPCWAIPSN